MTSPRPGDATTGIASPARFREIDTLRAIAALLVVWLHVAQTYGRLAPSLRSSWMYETLRWLDVGRVGVVVFFLISGFVVPSSIRAARAGEARRFLVKRAFRLFPAYWLSIPLAAWACWWLWGRDFGTVDLLVNFTLLQDWLGFKAAEGVYWTLLVEWVFYAMCVALLLSGRLHDDRLLFALAALGALLFGFAMFLRWTGHALVPTTLAFWFLNLSVMLCGALYRRWVDVGAPRAGRLGLAVASLFAFHLLALPAAATWAIGPRHNAALAYAVGFAVFLLGARWCPVRSRLTDWLGTISYSIYLFHPIVFMAAFHGIWMLPRASPWRQLPLGVYVGAMLLATLVVADLVYRLVEAPCIRWGRRVAGEVASAER